VLDWIADGSLPALNCGTESKAHYRIHVEDIEYKAVELAMAAKAAAAKGGEEEDG